MVYGIIDRLIVSNKDILIVDYKSHKQVDKDKLKLIADQYQKQMNLYAKGVSLAWPGKKIKAVLLFTHAHYLHPMEV